MYVCMYVCMYVGWERDGEVKKCVSWLFMYVHMSILDSPKKCTYVCIGNQICTTMYVTACITEAMYVHPDQARKTLYFSHTHESQQRSM